MNDTIIEEMSRLSINNSEELYTNQIINMINESAQEGLHSLVYEIITLNKWSISNMCSKIKTTFPEISLKIEERRIYIDWS